MPGETNPEDAAALHRYAVELADGVQAALGPWVVRNVLRVHALWTASMAAGGAAGGAASGAAGGSAVGGATSPRRAGGAASGDVDDELRRAAEVAGAACAADVGAAVREVLLQDIDDQRTNPLAVVRRAVAYPTSVLRAAGVPPLERDRQAEVQFPDDDYDLMPAAFRDLDPALHEPGLRWGAAKAHVHLRRHRST